MESYRFETCAGCDCKERPRGVLWLSRRDIIEALEMIRDDLMIMASDPWERQQWKDGLLVGANRISELLGDM